MTFKGKTVLSLEGSNASVVEDVDRVLLAEDDKEKIEDSENSLRKESNELQDRELSPTQRRFQKQKEHYLEIAKEFTKNNGKEHAFLSYSIHWIYDKAHQSKVVRN